MEETKKCNCCGRELPMSAFRKGGYGTLGTCNECMKKKQVEGKRKKKEVRDLEAEIANAKKMRLEDFTPSDLMEELSRRGYTGKLKFVQVKEIDISNF